MKPVRVLLSDFECLLFLVPNGAVQTRGFYSALTSTSLYLTDNAGVTPTRPSLNHSVQGSKLPSNGGSCKDSCKEAGMALTTSHLKLL